MSETKHTTGPVGFNVSAELGAGRQISIGGNFDPAASAEQINQMLDLVVNAVERQQAKTAVVNAEAEIMNMERQIRYQREDVERIDGRHKGKTIPVNERQQREASILNIRRMEEDLKTKHVYLDELKALAK
jgi:hypothetical protein